jgi:taurine--2-oxoglutarate transaminase
MSERRDLPFFFTWTAQKSAEPVELCGGDGSWLVTDRGERHLDLGALSYQASLGHGHPRIVEAIREQAGRLCLSMPGAVYPEKIALADKLLEHAPPGFSKVFFTLGGAEANENALKMARLVTGKFKLISRYRSYHGASMGAVTLSGDWRRLPVEPGLPGVVHVLDLDREVFADGDGALKSHIPRVLELEGGVGAVFLEPVVGANGVLIPPPGYFQEVRAACDRHGALLVVDEVLTGFGRTGRWFAIEHWGGVVPDMITCGKALTAGYGVLGAVLVHERVASHFDEKVLVAGLTHYGHPLGIAAALETLKVYEDEALVERAAGLEVLLSRAFDAWRVAMPSVVKDHRAIGLLGAVDVTLDSAGFSRLRAALAQRRVMLHLAPRVGSVILAPALNIPEEDLREGLRLTAEAIEEASHG